MQRLIRSGIAIDDNIENDKPKIIAEDAISLANVAFLHIIIIRER